VACEIDVSQVTRQGATTHDLHHPERLLQDIFEEHTREQIQLGQSGLPHWPLIHKDFPFLIRSLRNEGVMNIEEGTEHLTTRTYVPSRQAESKADRCSNQACYNTARKKSAQWH